ncbi:MAG: peptidase M15 [Actinobacteria bacterium]|nr:MAG: peptidase M15 [Actinomycetota bacterium]
MTHAEPSGRPPRLTWILVAGLLVIAASAAVLGLAQRVSSSATAALPTAVRGDQRGELGAPAGDFRGGDSVALGAADGVLPSGTTVFDDGLPGVAKLDPALLDALRRASTDARHEGVHIYVDSGWRSRKYQEQLFRQAVSEYGSDVEAARWVATPGTSPHVSGNAIDIGQADATAWLSEHGAKYGLCQIYSNEPWHYELRPVAINRGCPRMYDDPTQDPRMQQ